MSGAQTHPRRRALKPTDCRPPSLSTHGMHLRKVGTFSLPKSPNDLCDMLDNFAFMPRRSPTNTEALEELVNEDPSILRVTQLLKDFDRKLAGHKSSSITDSHTLEDDAEPLPGFFVKNTSFTPMEIDKPVVVERSHDHASDSGLGTSLTGSKFGKAPFPAMERPPVNLLKDDRSVSSSVTSAHSAITQSVSGQQSKGPTLSEHGRKEIQKNIIDKLLAEESLENFHPLVEDLPRRILNDTIKNLRDLEKTLIFLAPVSGLRYLSESAKAHCIRFGFKNHSATPESYQRFCERTIQLMVVTFERLSTHDQRLPTDRPYTNYYFLDLMEQIRRYAAIMAATREKEARGETLDEMDYSRDEKIVLRGGLSHDGTPAELVRQRKDGEVIPLVTESEKTLSPFKRTFEDEDMNDEEAMRSMARRRKSEKPGDVMHRCRECKKEFKRPCDLTKHEKTHSRPWKCKETSCVYHTKGWPTEKECDRHWNDKHSAAPPQYACQFEGCTYVSKRESNCKQHMEKAHNWTYERSKSNGRKKAPVKATKANAATLQSPVSSHSNFSGTSAFPTPVTPFMASPFPSLPMDFDQFPVNAFGTPAMSNQDYADEYRRDSLTTNTTEGSVFTGSSNYSPVEPLSFDAVTPEDTTFNSDLLGCNMNLDFGNAAAYQQPTPAMSNYMEPLNDFSLMNASNFNANASLPYLSPTAQPNVTFSTPAMPNMHNDEGFSEQMEMCFPDTSNTNMNVNQGCNDFVLYSDNGMSSGMDNMAALFPDLNQLGGQFSDASASPNNMTSTTGMTDFNTQALFNDQGAMQNGFDDWILNNPQ